MRKRPAFLVQPTNAHAQEALRLLGVPSPRDRVLADQRQRRADPIAEKPKAVTGNLDDQTAVQSLLETLEGQGRIVNKTERGGSYGQTFAHPVLVNANSPVQRFGTQSSADTPSTTNTATTVGAMTTTLTLGVGVWTINVKGSVVLTHDTGGTSAVTVQIDGVEGTARTFSAVPTSGGVRVVASSTAAGVVGERDVNVRVRFRSETSGTTAAKNPEVDVEAWRTE